MTRKVNQMGVKEGSSTDVDVHIESSICTKKLYRVCPRFEVPEILSNPFFLSRSKLYAINFRIDMLQQQASCLVNSERPG